MTGPVTVVLDNLELLVNQECLDAVAEVALRLPRRSQLALASRARPSLPEAVSQPRGQLLEIGADELAMDELEARALLEHAGVRLSDAEVTELIDRTEGWPVGLYLASFGAAGEEQRASAAAFAGNGHPVAAQPPAALLARLSEPTVAFLTRTAVLDQLSGPLCDAVLQVSGSDEVLESLAGSNLHGLGGPPRPVVPLPPAAPGAAPGRAGAPRARAGPRAAPAGRRLPRGRRAARAGRRPPPGRRGRRPGGPAGGRAGLPGLCRRAGRDRAPVAAVVRGPGPGRALPAGRRARGADGGVARQPVERRALGGRGRARAGVGSPRPHPRRLVGAAADLPVPRRHGRGAGRRRRRPGRAGPGRSRGRRRPCSWRGSATCWTARPSWPSRS